MRPVDDGPNDPASEQPASDDRELRDDEIEGVSGGASVPLGDLKPITSVNWRRRGGEGGGGMIGGEGGGGAW